MNTDRIIILRTIKHSESDLIIHGLTRSGSKLNFIAKGALKSKKRFSGGVLEPINYIQVEYQKKSSHSSSDLYYLNEAKLITGFSGIRTDYNRIEVALYFLKLASQVGREELDENAMLFDLLGNSLKLLETSTQIFKLRSHFEAKLLAQQGVLDPSLPYYSMVQKPLHHHEDLVISKEHSHMIKEGIQELL